MQITSNYAFNQPRKQLNPSFKAKLIPVIEKELILQARNNDCLMDFIEQLKNISSWGSPKSFITKIKGQRGERLVLENFHLSNYKTGELGVNRNKNLLDQFLLLKEENIINAEQDLIGQVKSFPHKGKRIYYA